MLQPGMSAGTTHTLNDGCHPRYLTMFIEPGLYSFSFTPMTNMGASGEGAVTTTRWAPAEMCA